ncbi:hypothetical protein BKA62DRAFT_685345 [Auriculariales sp. MPI-PUGE-AT-0066]|nr:hypothetical protein BKA62DRAFT_685345 [Auriculariales sp. MPI-PUGE-AT-0066]
MVYFRRRCDNPAPAAADNFTYVPTANDFAFAVALENEIDSVDHRGKYSRPLISKDIRQPRPTLPNQLHRANLDLMTARAAAMTASDEERVRFAGYGVDAFSSTLYPKAGYMHYVENDPAPIDWYWDSLDYYFSTDDDDMSPGLIDPVDESRDDEDFVPPSFTTSCDGTCSSMSYCLAAAFSPNQQVLVSAPTSLESPRGSLVDCVVSRCHIPGASKDVRAISPMASIGFRHTSIEMLHNISELSAGWWDLALGCLRLDGLHDRRAAANTTTPAHKTARKLVNLADSSAEELIHTFPYKPSAADVSDPGWEERDADIEKSSSLDFDLFLLPLGASANR